jgi:tetratricopeptide (TPR) repeat protein
MMTPIKKATPFILCISIWLLGNTVAMAHPAIEEHIEQLSAKLAKQPNDAELLVDRGSLYLEHSAFDNALRDFTVATTREPKLGIAWFSRAQVELAMGNTDAAFTSNAAFLKLHSQDINTLARIHGLFQQGDIYMAAAKPTEAAKSYQQAITASSHASPEQYLQLINALQQSRQNDKAIETIGHAIQANGELPQLLEKACDIELAQQKPTAAIQWLDKLLLQPQRHEYLLLRKGLIQRDMHDETAAQQSFDAALQAIEALPKTRRYSEATLTLEHNIEQAKDGSQSATVTPQEVPAPTNN